MDRNSRSPTSNNTREGGNAYPSHKRVRHSTPGPEEDTEAAATATTTTSEKNDKASISNFRNVSACNRCRLRKNRCDQQLPSCASCVKANVKCVGYDPITKREIPRSYVFYLESRVAYLEKLLQDNSVSFAAAEAFDGGARSGSDFNTVNTPSDEGAFTANGDVAISSHKQSMKELARNKRQNESDKIEKLVSNIGSVSVQGASDSRYLGSTSGISFARVVFAAVKSSVSGTGSDRSGVRPSKPLNTKAANPSGTSMRDSFFGLHTKPTIKKAPFPDKEVGRRLVEHYFEHANPQMPILHKGEFMKMFDSAYADGDSRTRTPRELYMLNIVFAIGSGIFLGHPDGDEEEKSKRGRRGAVGRQQSQPEEYHASAIVHLEACLGSSTSADRVDGFGGGLEELQAVLLLAGFALLRPVAPGLWYIIGVAVRLALDLGLHYEDGKDIETGLEGELNGEEENDYGGPLKEPILKERGRREWVRDFRRRLWWCTYSFDRLVSTCVGRPFGITDEAVTTEFPTLLDDKYITPRGFLEPPGGGSEPTYKHVAYHYFRLRLLQSEILQVLNHQQAHMTRSGNASQRNPYTHTTLPSPFLSRFDSFRSWRMDIDRRLWEWKDSAPTKVQTGVDFCTEFLELNYWQCVILLYRQSLSVPTVFKGEYSTSDEVQSPSMQHVEVFEDEERVFLKVAEAGQKVLRLYRQLHRLHLVNYTFLSTHHLFMAGISFLYALWHSPVVRSRLTMDEVDFTILAATSVLGDMIEKCPPADTCRDAFDRMSKATVQMCMSTTGFGSSGQGLDTRTYTKADTESTPIPNPPRSRPKHRFDMSLTELLDTSPPQPTPLHPAAPQPVKPEYPPASLPYPSQEHDAIPYPPSTAYQDFTYTAADADLGFLPNWDLDMHDGFAAHGLGWESADHDFSEVGGGGLPDLFEGFYFGGAGNM